MKQFQIEAWAIKVIERVIAGQPNEDARVELKAQWPEVEKAARQIAGHANAARGEPILWLIGVDQKAGVCGADPMELANWYHQVKAQFDELAPFLVDLNVPWKGSTVVALLFETDRAPFVVKNPMFGKPNGGSIRFEVPWRENTSTRSAGRLELLKLLVPIQPLPDIEVRSGWLRVYPTSPPAQEAGEGEVEWELHQEFYITPRDQNRVVIPYHRCKVTLSIPGELAHVPFDKLKVQPPYFWHPGSELKILSSTIASTKDEAIIEGPGTLWLDARVMTSMPSRIPPEDAQLAVSFTPVNMDRPIALDLTMTHRPLAETPAGSKLLAVWFLNEVPDWIDQ